MKNAYLSMRLAIFRNVKDLKEETGGYKIDRKRENGN